MNLAMFPSVFSGGDIRATTTARNAGVRIPNMAGSLKEGFFMAGLEAFCGNGKAFFDSQGDSILLILSPLFGKITCVQAGSKCAISM